MSSTPRSLTVSGLQAGYGKVSVVTDATFEVHPGEMVALVGRNGAGKTTSLAAVAGLRFGPVRGAVRVGSDDITTASPDRIVSQGVKLVPEGRRIFRSMTVFENLRLGAYPHRQSRHLDVGEELGRVWELFPPLSTCANKLAGELSGGQQQMVAIGQALMSRPRFLLLDEPSSGLAPVLVDEMYDRMDELAATGIGLLIVDQNVERILDRTTRYYLMEAGAVVKEGASDDPDALEAINAVIMATKAAEGF
jgi:branched-chain amino acid transport system ATP-binding protein